MSVKQKIVLIPLVVKIEKNVLFDTFHIKMFIFSYINIYIYILYSNVRKDQCSICL